MRVWVGINESACNDICCGGAKTLRINVFSTKEKAIQAKFDTIEEVEIDAKDTIHA